MSVITIAAGVLLAAFIWRSLDDAAFAKNLLFWWVVFPVLLLGSLIVMSSFASAEEWMARTFNSMSPQEKQCAVQGVERVKNIDESDPEYFKEAAYLFGVPIEEYKQLFVLRYSSRCNYLIDCQANNKSERLCRYLQPY